MSIEGFAGCAAAGWSSPTRSPAMSSRMFDLRSRGRGILP
jgi:hypothetical protein